MSDQEHRAVSPLVVQITLWIVVAVLTLYGAGAVRDELTKSEDLSDVEWLSELATSGMQVADTVGLSTLEAKLQHVREVLNAPYTVLVDEPAEDVPPPPPPIVEPSPGETGRLAHRAAPRKRRVLVIGASSIQFAVGVELEKRLPTFEGVRVKRFGQLATGLSRPDFMDWPKKLEELASTFKPDLVITNFGGNDAQSIPIGKYDKVSFSSPEWDDKYAERVKEIIRIAEKHGADTVMLGMPVMRKESFTSKILRLNRVTKKAAEEEGALYISTFEMASTKRGKYRKTISVDGKRGLMRTSDGIHYTRLGAKFVVEQVMQIVERHFVFEGPEKDRAVATRHAFTSKLLGRDVEYVAYVPRGEGPSPMLVVLPEPSWKAWPKHPHRTLQTVAQARGLVIVVPELDPAEHEVFAEELLVDTREHLPVTDRIGLAGSSAALALAAQHRDAFGSLSVTGALDKGAEALDALPVLLTGAAAGGAAELTTAGAEVETDPSEDPLAKLLSKLGAWHAARLAPAE